jgi:sec-independent protein translocase protein TatB
VNLLNVGPWELTVILIIAILVVGPKRMVEIARTIGRVTSQLRRLSAEFTSNLQSEIMSAEREAKQARDDTVESLTSLAEPFVSLQAELQATERETRQALESIATGRTEPVESTQAEPEAKHAQDDTVESLSSLAEPFVSLQTELQATERETRQALESIATGRTEPVESTQAETQATAPETDPALENAQDHTEDKPSQEAQ